MSEFFIKRPVFTLVFTFILIISGLIHFKKIPLSYLPHINNNIISISTAYNGASPQLIEKELTIPIENALAGINGIKIMRSYSKLNKSYIKLELAPEIALYETANKIRNKLAALQRKLPKLSDSPKVKISDDEASPIILVGFLGESAPIITEYLKNNVITNLQQTLGVGESFLWGGRSYIIKIKLDLLKLASYKISIGEIQQALAKENYSIPIGQLKSKNRNYTVVAKNKLSHISDIKNVVIKYTDKKALLLRNIADIEIGSEKPEQILRINGRKAVAIAIIAQSNANPLTVVENVKETLSQLKHNFPENIKAKVIFDSSVYIKQSLKEVIKSFLEALIFVALIIYLFLGSIKIAFIPLVTIPICIIASFWPMYIFNINFNILTLLAFVLAIGLVVDDAIIVLENCHRHLKDDIRQACITGTNEIVFALIAMTLTLAAVYLPVGFISGPVGTLFWQFGFVLMVTVCFSGIIALSLTPVLCANLLSLQKPQRFNQIIEKLKTKYYWHLKKTLQKPYFLISAIILLFGSAIVSFHYLNTTLIEDKSYIVTRISSPSNANTNYTNYYSKKLEDVYKKIPSQSIYLTNTSAQSVFSLLMLKPKDVRKTPQATITKQLNKTLKNFIGVSAYATNPANFNKDKSKLEINITSSSSYARINKVAAIISKSLDNLQALSQVRSSGSAHSEQIEININTRNIADARVEKSEIKNLIATYMNGINIHDYAFNGHSYKVYIKMKDAGSFYNLKNLYVRSTSGNNIPLRSMVEIKTINAPKSLNHYNQQRNITISAKINDNANLKTLAKEIRKTLTAVIPEGFNYHFSGAINDYLNDTNKSIFAFGFAILFIYLFLSAQFESFIDPLIILCSVPISLSGAFITLYVIDGSLNIYTYIGFVTLIGLISKQGIMITEFANNLQVLKNYTPRKAILTSASLRLRPIIMTTSAMVLGIIPLILTSGAGFESKNQLGAVLVSGLIVGSSFSLYALPYAYLLANHFKNNFLKYSDKVKL